MTNVENDRIYQKKNSPTIKNAIIPWVRDMDMGN